MKFNWYQLNVVNRNRVLPVLGIIKFIEGGAVSSAHALQLQLASWPRVGVKQCSSAVFAIVRILCHPLLTCLKTPPSASRTTEEPVIEQLETAADPPSTVDTIVAKVLEALQKQQQPGTSGSSSDSSGK